MYRISLLLKRLFDLVSACLLTILLTPVLIAISVAVKRDSPGPVFFKQDRRTKDGRVFCMLKFRSMVVNAETMDEGLFNYENDHRVTKVGSFLRSTSLDELPQLFNIIIGDMSVVGPRPCVTYELGDFDTLNKRYKKRFEMKAGLTGLAQVKGRNGISWDDKVNFDNQYVDDFRRIGVLADVKILVQSVFTVFKKENIFEKKQDDFLSNAEAARFEEEEIIRKAHIPD